MTDPDELEAARKEEEEGSQSTLPALEAPLLSNKNRKDRYLGRADDSFHIDSSIHHAHALYLNYATIDEISRITGVKVDVVRYFVYRPEGWKSQRDQLEADIAEEVKKTSLDQLRRINNLCLDAIERGVKDFHDYKVAAKEMITLKEAHTITNIWQKVHDGKLSEEMVESGVSLLSKTPQDVLRAFREDPFLGDALRTIDVTPKKTDEQVEKESPPVPDAIAIAKELDADLTQDVGDTF